MPLDAPVTTATLPVNLLISVYLLSDFWIRFFWTREAGLIRGERRGVEMQNTSRCPEIETRFPGLIPAIVNAYNVQLQAQRPTRNEHKRKPIRN